MAEIVEPGGELLDAVWEAVDRGMARIQETGGPLIPFLMRWEEGDPTISTLMGESMEDAIAMGKEVASASGSNVRRAVLAWDGFVTIEGQRTDALFVQAYERGAPVSHLMVQRYEPSEIAHFRTVGNVTLIGQEAPLFAAAPGEAAPVDAAQADVRSVVVKGFGADVHDIHVIVTVRAIADAKSAILRSLDATAAQHRSDSNFGGQVKFVVRGPVPGSDLPPELSAVQSEVDARLAASNLRTATGRPVRARIEYRQSTF